MNFAEAKVVKSELQNAVAVASANLDGFPKGPMGLVSVGVRSTEAYRIAKISYDRAFAEMRNFNAQYVKVFRKELAAERKARFA